MKLALFGATGRTGQHLLKQALAAGHQVTVLIRTPAKLPVQHDRLTVITGDATQPEHVDSTIQGVDAVISVLGPTENTPGFRVTRGTQNILSAMKKHSVRRLVMSAGAGVGDPLDAPALLNKLVNIALKLTSRHVYEDMLHAVEAVRASEVDWTIVRVPMLTDDPGSGRIRVAYVGKGMMMRIPREDMARFMLDQIDSTKYLHQSPAISAEG